MIGWAVRGGGAYPPRRPIMHENVNRTEEDEENAESDKDGENVNQSLKKVLQHTCTASESFLLKWHGFLSVF